MLKLITKLEEIDVSQLELWVYIKKLKRLKSMAKYKILLLII